MEQKARFFDKFDLAYYLSGDKAKNDARESEYLKKSLDPAKNITKYLAALNSALFEYHGELGDKELMSLEALFSRVWCHYIAGCIEWGSGKLVELVRQTEAERSTLPKRPNRDIIMIVDYPAEQDVDNQDINAVMFALIKREPTCPRIGTKAEVRYLKSYTDEEKFILPAERNSSRAYHTPEDTASIWQECVDQMYSALLCDAEPFMIGPNATELAITVYGDESIVEAFKKAKLRLTRPEHRDKVRVVQEPI